MNDIENLKKQILAANSAYRDGCPTMSDQSFDELCEKLEKLVSASEYSSFRDSLHETKGKVKHPFIMGSLDKLKFEDKDEVVKFVKSLGKTINVSAKVDGISCRVSYRNGRLTSATTRGDGSYGQDITDKAMFVKCLPHVLKDRPAHKVVDNESFEIRGELVITKDDFEKLNADHNNEFANARNACAGIMNRKDWSKDDVSYVTFVPYTILGNTYTKHEQFMLLSLFEGMTPAWNIEFEVDKIDDISGQLFTWASQEFAYETDGLVICSTEYKNEEKYRPSNCKAFKTNTQVAVTRLIDIEWSGPSKDGLFVGVGIIDPVELGGSTISRVTLHNIDFIEKLGLMYGSKVQITKRGDVIPHLDKLISNDSYCSPIEYPVECPSCSSTLVRDGINIKCTNHNCPEQVVHRLVNFIKKLGVKSASNATLLNFGITSFEKLMSFVPNKKYKSEVKLYDELYAKVFSQSKEKLLGAMNFVGLSETLVDKIVSYYGYSLVESSDFKDEAYKSLPIGVGSITLDRFIEDLPEALRYVEMIANDTRWHWSPSNPASSSSISRVIGSICVTGSLKFGSRSKFLEFAKEHGYESKSGVSKGLTYLVNNDINSNSSKNRKAKELGIKIIDEESFLKLLNDSSVESSLDEL